MFSSADQKLIELLAAHAAIAIENARLHERSPRAEHHRGAQPARARAARLASRSGCSASRWPPSPRRRCSSATVEGAAVELRAGVASSRAARWRSCARSSSSCGPGRWRPKGLATVLRKHVEVLRRVSGQCDRAARSATSRGSPRTPATQVLRIAQEALGNALRHSGAKRIAVKLGGDDERLLAERHRRRLRLRPGRPRGARPAARADLDGGARDRARRHAERHLDARRGHDRAAGGPDVIRVLLADDHAVVRQGLRTFLDLQDDIEVVAEAGDG